MTQGNNYYECDIKIDRLQDDGSQKFLKEKYLVKAATPTEAEKRMIDEFAAETIAELRNAVAALRKANVYAQRVDWLLSGDEEVFHERLKKELQELQDEAKP